MAGYYNLPPYLQPLLLAQLFKDQAFTLENLVNEEDKECYNYQHVLYIAKCKKRKFKKKLKKEEGTEALRAREEIRWYSGRDQELMDEADIKFIVDINKEPHNGTEKYEVMNCRAIIMITFAKFRQICEDADQAPDKFNAVVHD